MISLINERPLPSIRTPGRTPGGTPARTPVGTPGRTPARTPGRTPTRAYPNPVWVDKSIDLGSPVMWGVSSPSATSERRTMRHGVNRDTMEFSTPQRMTVMGRQHAVVEFRTPQHPLTGSNQWGGESPLIARNVPAESREAAYLKFNSLVSDSDDDEFPVRPVRPVAAAVRGGEVPRRRRGWLAGMMRWKPKKEKVLGGVEEKKKKSWLPGRGTGARWPQGWR